jgi:transmembrane sensor
MEAGRLKLLFWKYMEQSATADELDELMSVLADPSHEALVKEIAGDYWENEPARLLLSPSESQRVFTSIEHEIRPAQRIFLPRWRWAAAAAVLVLMAGVGSYLYISNKPQPIIAGNTIGQFDLPPGRNAAILTIAGGRQILLDSTARGMISRQGNTTVTNNNGQLTYKALGEKPTEIRYNTLTTERGNQYKLVLPDGSKVWLNAASSITYPTAFAGNDRTVTITGEAYFEVAHNPRQPFEVRAGGQTIRDIGTVFNINAYTDEPAIKTTLVEGAAAVNGILLKPGQQATLVNDNHIQLSTANIPETIAWKNGYFEFTDADIETVMRELSRWYAVTVEYGKHDENALFTGQIGRQLTASQAFQVLSETGYHFTITGNTIRVE